MKESSSEERGGGATMGINIGDQQHYHSPSPNTPKQNSDPDPNPTHPTQAQLLPLRPTKEVLIAYKECLKNHAAALGTHATDGCGEFMSSADSLRCSACGCHRNFHRKEVREGGPLGGGSNNTSTPYLQQCHYLGNTTNTTTPSGVLKARRGPPESAFGMGPATLRQDGDTLMEEREREGRGREVKKKRHRTKFTKEQKEKMVVFAEKAGWKIHRLEESLVQQFCQEVGIKRKVLKVWMHNNKHHFVKSFNNEGNVNLSPLNDTISNSNSSNS